MSDQRNPIDALAEEFVARHRAGERPSVTEYAARFPHLAEEVRELFPAALMLEEIKGPPPAPRAEAPRQLGDFRLLRELGRGGMGVVYEAEQVSLGRRVALKVLGEQARLGPGSVERFRREARAAGRLHHTNIVPVFGSGEDGGLHYYVMQLIQGEGLDRALKRLADGDGTLLEYTAPGPSASSFSSPPTEVARELGSRDSTRRLPPARLPAPRTQEHFRAAARIAFQVAEALAYAHAQGVLHRDIKPGNLLLDGRGNAWVTDFGLAKLFESEDLTRPGEMAGTLRYSPPERFRGQFGPAGDQFALGLVLYEMLTLRPAYPEAGAGELLLRATEGHVEPPEGFPADLATVLMRSLATEPERRYPGAAEMAEDLRRYLEDRPVLARREGWLEKARRWCRRYPAVALLSAALLLAVVAGFVGVTWKWREASAHLATARERAGQLREASRLAEEQRARAEEQRGRAEGNLDLARAAFERLSSKLGTGRPGTPLDEDGPGGPPVLSREKAALLEDIAGFYERFAAANRNDPRLVRDTAGALRRVGGLRLRLGQYDAAEAALSRAAEILAGLEGQEAERARVQNDLGVALRSAGRLSEAVEAHKAALGLLKKADDGLEEARAQLLLGSALWRLGLTKPAERGLREAMALLEAMPASAESRPLLARAYHELGQVLWLLKERVAAFEMRRKGLAALEALTKEFPKVPEYKAELADALMSVTARALLPRWQKENEKRCRRALELAEELAAQYPAAAEYQELTARAHQRLGVVLRDMGRPDEAASELRLAVKAYRDLEGKSVVLPGARLLATEARLKLADLLRQKRQFKDALELAREATPDLERLARFAPRNQQLRRLLAGHYRQLAQVLRKQGKSADAAELERKAEGLSKP